MHYVHRPSEAALTTPPSTSPLHSPHSGTYYVCANDESGLIRPWWLVASGDRVAIPQVDDFDVGSQAEGWVAHEDIGGHSSSRRRTSGSGSTTRSPTAAIAGSPVASVETHPELRDDIDFCYEKLADCKPKGYGRRIPLVCIQQAPGV